MFGYVMANKPELKVREFERYRGFYCGLCRKLKKRNGAVSQLTLTYDMTFLILFLSSLYEPAEKEERRRCLIHPAKKQRMICNEITDYAADMNVLLSYYHFKDDWEDERKCSALFASQVFRKKAKGIAAKYPRQSEVIVSRLERLAQLERQGVTKLDEISRPFGELMSELFVFREDAFAPILRRFGFLWENIFTCWTLFWIWKRTGKRGRSIRCCSPASHLWLTGSCTYWTVRCGRLS